MEESNALIERLRRTAIAMAMATGVHTSGPIEPIRSRLNNFGAPQAPPPSPTAPRNRLAVRHPILRRPLLLAPLSLPFHLSPSFQWVLVKARQGHLLRQHRYRLGQQQQHLLRQQAQHRRRPGLRHCSRDSAFLTRCSASSRAPT